MVTLSLLEWTYLNDDYRQPLEDSIDLDGFKEVAVCIKGSDVNAVGGSTLTVEGVHSAVNRDTDFEPLSSFDMTTASTTDFTYLRGWLPRAEALRRRSRSFGSERRGGRRTMRTDKTRGGRPQVGGGSQAGRAGCGCGAAEGWTGKSVERPFDLGEPTVEAFVRAAGCRPSPVRVVAHLKARGQLHQLPEGFALLARHLEAPSVFRVVPDDTDQAACREGAREGRAARDELETQRRRVSGAGAAGETLSPSPGRRPVRVPERERSASKGIGRSAKPMASGGSR